MSSSNNDINEIIANLPTEALTPAAAEALGRAPNPVEEGITGPPPTGIHTPTGNDVNLDTSHQDTTSKSAPDEMTSGGRRTYRKKGGRKQKRRKTHKKKRRSTKRH